MPLSTAFDAVNNVEPGKHFYQFYKQIEDYLRVTLPYFEAGLQKGEACLWLVSQDIGLKTVREEARNRIPECSRYLDSGQFRILSAEEWYLTKGCFDEEKSIANALHFLEESMKAGYQAIRGAGDGGAIPHTDWHRVMNYEKEMSVWMKGKPVTALCAYPILGCTLSDTKNILDEHDDVLVSKI